MKKNDKVKDYTEEELRGLIEKHRKLVRPKYVLDETNTLGMWLEICQLIQYADPPASDYIIIPAEQTKTRKDAKLEV